MNKMHRDPQELDLTKPRLASNKQKKWKIHQDTVYWVESFDAEPMAFEWNISQDLTHCSSSAISKSS